MNFPVILWFLFFWKFVSAVTELSYRIVFMAELPSEIMIKWPSELVLQLSFNQVASMF